MRLPKLWATMIVLVSGQFLYLAGFPPPTAAQPDLDTRVEKQLLDCGDIAFSCMQWIPEHYWAGDIDSVHVVLDYWEQRCSNIPAIAIPRLLLSINARSFDASNLSQDNLLNLLEFKRYVIQLAKGEQESHGTMMPPGSSVGIAHKMMYEVSIEYYGWIKQVASEVLTARETEGVEKLLLTHYSGDIDSTFVTLQSDAYIGTTLRSAYSEYTESLVLRPHRYYSLNVGLWSPVGSAVEKVGTLPEFGIVIGKKNGFTEYGALVALRFGGTNEEFYIGDRVVDDVLGGSIGVEYGLRPIVGPHSEFSVLLGTAVSFFGPRPAESGDDEVSGADVTLGLQYGLTPRFFGKYQISLQTKYYHRLFDFTSKQGAQGAFLQWQTNEGQVTAFCLSETLRLTPEGFLSWQAAGYECRTRLATLTPQEASQIQELDGTLAA